MAVAIMDTANEFSLLMPDYELHETLISTKKQDLYTRLTAMELGFSPSNFSDIGRDLKMKRHLNSTKAQKTTG